MKKAPNFNQLPEEVVKKTFLKPGEKVLWRTTKGGPNPLNPQEWLIPAAVQVPPIDNIYLPETGEYIQIAAIERVDPTGNHKFYDLWFEKAQAGQIYITGGRAIDQEIHTYLSLCNYNGSNPNRDTSKDIIFEIVDEERAAKEGSKKRNLKRDALNIAADLQASELKDYAAALGRDDTRPTAVLRAEMEELADMNAQAFMDLVNNKSVVVKATLNRAISQGRIIFDPVQSRYAWDNGEPIVTVAKTSVAIDELVAHCVSSAKGEKILELLKSKKPQKA